MKQRLLIALALGLAAFAAVNAQSQTNSPGQVLDQYLEMINGGALLTNDGWQKAALLFELPASPLSDNVIYVTTRHHPATHIQPDKDRLEIDENFVDPLGTIDSSMRFHRGTSDRDVEGTVFIYHLVLTDKHWTPNSEGKAPDVTHGAKQWKIEGSLKARTVSVDAAILYVTKMGIETTDLAVRRNADRTLTILKQLRPRTHS
jgi:hypothetical protein